MKRFVFVLVGISLFFMASCQRKTVEVPLNSSSRASSTKSESTDETTDSIVKTSSTVVEAETKSLWDSDKDAKLYDFMMGWGQTMNQTYKQYRPDNNVDLYGVQLPDDALKNSTNWRVAVAESPIEIAWSENGEVDAGYALVAVYSDADTQPYLSKHVYFFTIESGTPKVLVTSQNQGNPNNYLYFKETENQELKNGFESIVNS